MIRLYVFICFLVICCMSDYIMPVAELIIVEPNSSMLQNVIYSSLLSIEVDVLLYNDSVLPERTYICITEYGTVDDNVADKQCIAQNKFAMGNILSGTHYISITLEVFMDEGQFYQENNLILDTKYILFDSIDSTFLDIRLEQSKQAYALLQDAPHIHRYNYFYYHNNIQKDFQSIEQYTILAAPSGVNNTNKYELIHDKARTVVFFARTYPSFDPSDRFTDWLSQSTLFEEHNLVLSILAPTIQSEGVGKQGTPSNSLYDDVPVVQFAALTELYASSINSMADISSVSSGRKLLQEDSAALELLTQPTVLPLARYLCAGEADVLMVINTFGDAQTSLLLDVVLLLRTLQQQHRQSEHSQLYKTLLAELGQPYSWHLPKIVMDLPNLGLPSKWHHKLDAFVAPSRFVGLSELTTLFGRPVAVIFPPVRDLVISTSLCSDMLGEHLLCSAPAMSPHTKTCADEIDANKSDTSATDDNIRAGATEKEAMFHLLYVGRLHSLKSPGLLLRALGLLFRTAAAVSGSIGPAVWEGFRRDCYLSSSSVDEIAILEELNRLFEQAPQQPLLRQTTACLLREFTHRTVLTVVGDGHATLRAGLQQLAGDLQLQACVRFVGRRSAVDVMHHMRSADLLVNPIPTGETFGFIHIEAAAQGLPVLAFDMGANRESIVYSSTHSSNSGNSKSTYNLIKYRAGRAVQDLSLSIFWAFVHSLHESGDFSHILKRENKGSVCERLNPVFTHWNTKQHSYALIQALEQLLVL